MTSHSRDCDPEDYVPVPKNLGFSPEETASDRNGRTSDEIYDAWNMTQIYVYMPNLGLARSLRSAGHLLAPCPVLLQM